MRSILFALVLATFFPSVLFSQSLADVAKANRPKDATITTQRVFTDDDVKHGDPNQQVSTPQVKNPPAPKSRTDDVNIEPKTPEQLGFDCYGHIQNWPDAASWQQNLWTAHSALVDAAGDWNRDHTAKALLNLTAAQTAFTETKGGCVAAVNSWVKIENWKSGQPFYPAGLTQAEQWQLDHPGHVPPLFLP